MLTKTAWTIIRLLAVAIITGVCYAVWLWTSPPLVDIRTCEKNGGQWDYKRSGCFIEIP